MSSSLAEILFPVNATFDIENIDEILDTKEKWIQTAKMFDDGLVFSNIEEFTKSLNDYMNAAKEKAETVSKETKKTFEQVWNASDFSDAKDKLLDLAKAGTISAETIKSTKDYKSLIDDTGLTAEEATRKIMDLLSAQERLSAASEGIKSLQTAYKEFTDENIGFVTAPTLEGLPDVFKTLKTYDFNLFEEIVGDPNSGVQKIQQAFNDIATAYIREQGTMNGLIDASESEVNSYIANLKEMGITNAEEVVTNARKSLSENNKLLIEAEKEYSKYLSNKEGYDIQYIQSVNSKNSQLISKLGSAYQTDYDNWKELITKKADAYNQFVNSLNAAQQKMVTTIPAAGDSAEKLARQIVNSTKTDGSSNSLGVPKMKSILGVTNDIKAVTPYSDEQIKWAREYLETLDKYKASVKTLQLNMEEISIDLGDSALNLGKPLSELNEEAKKAAEEAEKAKENFDWIERKLQNITDALNDLKDASDNTYSSWANRSNALTNAINTTRQAIDLQQQAYNRYMREAESVGLSDVYKNLIKNGAIDISVINDEDLKDKIKQYQEWYDKAKNCLDTQKDLKDSLNELNSKKFDNIQSIFDFDKGKIEHFLNTLNNQIDVLEMKGLFATEGYYNEMLNYTQKEINSLANERAQLANVMNSSGLSQDSEAWQNMYSTLIGIDEEMEDLNKNMVEFSNNIRDLNWEIFEYLEESINRITDETEYFVSLLADKELFDDNGNFNKYANATVAMRATAFDTYKQQAQDYLEEMQDLQRQVVAGAGKDVLEQYNKMVDAHRDAVLSANKEKQAMAY